MDTLRRYRYLSAMGVQLWCRRSRLDAKPAERSGGAHTDAGAKGSVADPKPARRGRSGAAASASLSREAPGIGSPAPGRADARPSGSRGPPGAATGANAGALDWQGLRAAVAACRACPLCETRIQTVFGVGDPNADLMVIGEAPGADEDRAGEPFVGRAGQLLNLMLEAIGLRREQVFIANILKCRPPGNRDPRPEEARQCEPYLQRQVELVAPRVILAVGRVSAQNLLRTDAPIGRLRGRWHRFGGGGVPLYVTYHPAYLLRTPDQKAAAWRDLLQVLRRLRQPEKGSDNR